MKSALHTIKRKNAQGFTLIELLVVIGILAVLLAIVLVAINPVRQFAKANNTQRSSDTTAILNAISSYTSDNEGKLPPSMTSLTAGTAYTITDATGATNVNLCPDIVSKYIADMPIDPAGTKPTTPPCTGYNTGYTVSVSSSDNRVTVCAPSTDLTDTGLTSQICVTR